MTNGRTSFLAVIDPTRTNQWALEKAIEMASIREDAVVHPLLCVHSRLECDEAADLKAAEMRRHTLWLNEILERFDAAEVRIEPMVAWHEDWREAICDVAADLDVDLVVKRASGRPDSLASSDRYLIRMLGRALLLVNSNPEQALAKVLVAVDFNAGDESHELLNNAIIDLGRRIRGTDESIELHAISAYPDSDKFVHPPDVAKRLDIDRSQAHVRQGKAVDIIPAMTNQIDADLVIIGNVGRRGLSGITIGNTAEKILAAIMSDVLILMQEDQRARAAA